MKQLPLYFLFILVGLRAQPLHAQQVYQSHHFGGPGTEFLYNRLFGFTQDSILTKAGANITWDLTAFPDLKTHVSDLITPDAAFDFFTFVTICGLGGNTALECATIWANTQHAWQIHDTLTLFQFQLAELQRFHRKTNTRLLENFIGFNVDLGGFATPAVIVYDNPDTILHFPVVYGDQFTSSTSWSLDLSATGQNIKYQSFQTRETAIDGWGTLVTAHQTFTDVVRMRSEIHRQDSITTDSFSAPIVLTQVEYMWLDTNYKMPIMTANGIVTDSNEVLGTIEYLYDSVCETATWNVSTNGNVFYTDSTGSVTIEFIINNPNADEYTWDWGNGELEVTTGGGSVFHTFPEPGSYSIGITGCMLNCLPLNNCAFDIVDLEVLVSVPVIPGEQLGIKLFPNPVNDELYLDLPENLEFTSYIISDLTGTENARGNFTPGHDAIPTTSLSAGLYVLRLLHGANPAAPNPILRFAVIKN